MKASPITTWHIHHYDRWLLVSIVLLMAIGLLMVASASMVISDQQYHFPFHYLVRQTIYLTIGLLLTWLVCHVPLMLWQRWSAYLFLASLLLLILV